MIKTEFPITNKFLEVKRVFKNGVNLACREEVEHFDNISGQLLIDLAEMTIDGMGGDTIIEGVKLDLWKDRVWHLIERVGILPEYKDIEGDIEEMFMNDNWYSDEEEEFDVDDEKFFQELGFIQNGKDFEKNN
jgi:hypothetical protein